MTKRKRKSKSQIHERPWLGDLNDPQSLGSLTRDWLTWLRVHNYSQTTLKTGHQHINHFIRWAETRNLTRPHGITKPILERYQRHLYQGVNAKGKRLTIRSQAAYLATLCSWFKWLVRQNHLTSNPASELQRPRIPKALPARVLSHQEVETLLGTTDVQTSRGIRDRAIMEVFYGTGIRRMELAGLDLDDIQISHRTVWVRRGKGQKDRVVPISKRAVLWLEKYLYEVRQELIIDLALPAMFLTLTGNRFSPDELSVLVRKYLRQSGVADKGGPHMLRHSMATSMLAGGADIRFIQAILGHARLETTEIYTHVNIQQLKDIMDATHPAKDKRSDSPHDSDDPSRSLS